jgi:hypothetical protein
MGNWFSNIFNPSATNEQWLSSTTGILHDQFYDPSNPEQPGYNGSGPKSSIPGTLHAIHDHIATANDTYRKTAQDLDNPHTYQGGGANAFFAAVDADVNHSLPVMDSFQHAAGAAAILGSSITASSQKYDSRIAGISAPAISSPFADLIGIFAPSTTVPSNLYYKWRDRLISTFFGNMINMAASNHSDLLSEFLQYGSGTMDGPWTAAVNTVQGIVTTDADQYASSQFDPAVAEREAAQLLNDLNPFLSSSTKANSDKVTQQNVEQIESQFHQQVQQAFTKAFDNLAQDLHGHITGWAGELQASYSTFQTSMKNVDVLTAGDLFQFIHGMNPNGKDGTQNTADPITITPYTTRDGKKGLLITLAGLDPNHPGYDTDIFDALQTGQGGYNPYEADVERAIMQYMKEHPEMAGAQLTFAGYSYGGMTAQQVADDINNHDLRNPLSQYDFQVANVITYGAPVMGAPQPGVHYAMYDATYDPVPLLSNYENPELGQTYNPFDTSPRQNLLQKVGQIVISPITYQSDLSQLSTVDALPWNQKLHTYIDPTGQYGNQIHNISDVGNTYLGKGGPPFLYNHQQYQSSDQLNAPTPMSTASTNSNIGDIGNIDPNSLGPTEYFGMQNKDNWATQAQQGTIYF